MKIAIIGYSGSGKSTLAQKLSAHYGCDVLYLDSVHFAPDWVEKSDEEMTAAIRPILEKDSWVIDGNYSRILHQQRMADADQIIMLLFNRFACLWRAWRRYRTFKGATRPDMAPGCPEKLDWEFVRWILRDGRTARARKRYQDLAAAYPDKVVILKNQRQLDAFTAAIDSQQKTGL